MQVTGVLSAIAVGVADLIEVSDGSILKKAAVAYQGSLPVVMEKGVADGHIFRSVGDIEKSIVVILVMCRVTRKVAMVDPNVLCGRALDPDRVTIGGQNLLDREVPNDDIRLLDQKSESRENLFPLAQASCLLPRQNLPAWELAPMIDLFAPTLTWSAVLVMAPLTTTMRAVSSVTAAVN